MTTSGVLVHSLLETRPSFPPSILSSVWIFLVLGFLVFLSWGSCDYHLAGLVDIYYRSYTTGLATLTYSESLTCSNTCGSAFFGLYWYSCF